MIGQINIFLLATRNDNESLWTSSGQSEMKMSTERNRRKNASVIHKSHLIYIMWLCENQICYSPFRLESNCAFEKFSLGAKLNCQIDPLICGNRRSSIERRHTCYFTGCQRSLLHNLISVDTIEIGSDLLILGCVCVQLNARWWRMNTHIQN